MPSKGFDSSYRGSNAPGAYYHIAASDFGSAAPVLVNGDLAYNAGAGSLAMSTAHVQITWITAEGESLPSAEATVSVSASTGAVTVTHEAAPTNGATVIGWRVYSSATMGSEELQVNANSTTQVQTNFTTTQGVLKGFPIATAAVQILIYGTGATVPVTDQSGIQTALPSVGANATKNYFAVVPNSGSQWKTYKAVDFMRPDGTQEAAGISLSQLDCIQPLYPGTSQSVSAGAYMVMNGYLFVAAVGGTTAATFIGFSKFNLTKAATTTDGTVTWESLGKAALIRFLFSNASGSAATPVAQTYDIFEF